jgi:predicted enzyme related to lactoylglutathione lyase
MLNPVSWFEIYVDDMPRAKSFYETLFDIKLQKLDGTEIEMEAFPISDHVVGAPGALARMPGFSAGGNGVIIYFKCEDCAVQVGRVHPAGGKVLKDKFSIGPFGYIALVYDTEGNLIGLHSQK